VLPIHNATGAIRECQVIAKALRVVPVRIPLPAALPSVPRRVPTVIAFIHAALVRESVVVSGVTRHNTARIWRIVVPVRIRTRARTATYRPPL